MDWHDTLRSHWHAYNEAIVNDGDPLLHKREKRSFERKREQLGYRKAQIVKATSKAQIVGYYRVDRKDHVRYGIHHQWLIKQKENFYIEEAVEERVAVFLGGDLIEDQIISHTIPEHPKNDVEVEHELNPIRFGYDRQRAVQYAERWWNEYNPAYRQFDVDCTNYVSQCLHAGGAPMRGYPNRSQGWWYQATNWSYSWSVAHSLRWYLSSSKSGLQANEVNRPEQLELGDVICYDFDGDGRWQHTTIVVAKDQNNMPLVNAHTTNSRMRYWAYEDSTAWTNHIQYKFFHIRDR